MCHILFVHSSVSGHLGCFHGLAIANSAAVNTGVHVSFWIVVFSGYMPNSEISGSYGIFIASFLRKGIIFSGVFDHSDFTENAYISFFSTTSLIHCIGSNSTPNSFSRLKTFEVAQVVVTSLLGKTWSLEHTSYETFWFLGWHCLWDNGVINAKVRSRWILRPCWSLLPSP